VDYQNSVDEVCWFLLSRGIEDRRIISIKDQTYHSRG